jgi:hypothetical protein
MNHNKRLFWYGFKAKLIQAIGIMVGICSFFYILTNPIIFLVGVIVGLIIVYFGSSQRFDYQRQSGHIIHGGDGW